MSLSTDCAEELSVGYSMLSLLALFVGGRLQSLHSGQTVHQNRARVITKPRRSLPRASDYHTRALLYFLRAIIDTRSRLVGRFETRACLPIQPRRTPHPPTTVNRRRT